MYPSKPDFQMQARARMRAAAHPDVQRAYAEREDQSPQTGQAAPMAGPNDTSGQKEVQTSPASEALERLAAKRAGMTEEKPSAPPALMNLIAQAHGS